MYITEDLYYSVTRNIAQRIGRTRVFLVSVTLVSTILIVLVRVVLVILAILVGIISRVLCLRFLKYLID
jgi:hypothetical protein